VLARYVVTDLWRNPRRTLSALIGVILGIGLFCGVLFFIDGLSASMTQRAVAPLTLDMQRIVTDRAASDVTLNQELGDSGMLSAGEQTIVELTVVNAGELDAREVTIRSVPAEGFDFVPGSALLDGQPLTAPADNPFASGAGRIGLNLGTLAPGATHRLSYEVQVAAATQLDTSSVTSTYSSRESVTPIVANGPSSVGLAELETLIAELPGVASANQLSLADLGLDALTTPTATAFGPTRIFGFDDGYAASDPSIVIVQGALSESGAAVSVEVAGALSLLLGDTVTVAMPDGSSLELKVTGIADLTGSRSLFSSRRGGDLETFSYTRNSVIVSPGMFADVVFPAYERAISEGTERLKSPPIREIDIEVDRGLLDADPATAVGETSAIAADVMAVAEGQDYLLDNITNTLTVARGDAGTAKNLFVFLGVPGGLLAAILPAYAGGVLAQAQRREQAILRVRGASRNDLLRMLALRTILLTAAGAVVGLVTGYLATSAILGPDALARAGSTSLIASALVGSVGGFVATSMALYLVGRRSIDREITADRAHPRDKAPLWRRWWLDLAVVAALIAGTVVAVLNDSFSGQGGSVYFGRSVELSLPLLLLPLGVWMSGCLIVARLTSGILTRVRPTSTPRLRRPALSLVRRSIGRRPGAIGTGAVVLALIVGFAVSLAAFTASYEAAKTADARYANGADVKITPILTVDQSGSVGDGELFLTPHISDIAPVVYASSNVILRSARTSDPANLAAVDPVTFANVSPLDEATASTLQLLDGDPDAVLVSAEMADFLKAKVGDPLDVLLARATGEQVETRLTIVGLFERLPGFPDGAEAVMNISRHIELVPTTTPDFFLAATSSDGAGLNQAVEELQAGPASADHFRIETRESTLDRDQSSLAALNVSGLVNLNFAFALAIAVVAIGVFVFGLLLQRRREYVTLRAQGLKSSTVTLLIAAETAVLVLAGILGGTVIGGLMGYYFVLVLRPLFVLTPSYTLPPVTLALIIGLVLVAMLAISALGSRLVNSLKPTELLRDE